MERRETPPLSQSNPSPASGGTPSVIVDGNNVMGSRPDGWWRDRGQAMQRLIDGLHAHATHVGGRWTVVFDGQPRAGLSTPRLGLQVDYGGNSADDRIVEIVSRAGRREHVLVYTSDRGLRSRVLALGARVEGAAALLQALAPK